MTLYLLCFAVSLALSALLTPLMRRVAIHLNILDHPHSDIKTHRAPVPYLGGLAIAVAFTSTLIMLRFLTNFPTGTLRSLRGILMGGLGIVALGLFDDIVPKGLGFKHKFVFQFLIAFFLILFDIRIHFIQPAWLSILLSALWIVGITNALNIVDVLDGLAAGLSFVASITFLVIALPSEDLYVNFAAVSLAGACLGFLPFNLSQRLKIFMGDTGSLFLGYLLAALSLGTSYSGANPVGVLAPLLILGVPIYDTSLVVVLRFRKGQSPFLGSKDHFALRLQSYGFYREEILLIAYGASLFLSFAAYLITQLPLIQSLVTYGVVAVAASWAGAWLSKITIE